MLPDRIYVESCRILDKFDKLDSSKPQSYNKAVKTLYDYLLSPANDFV